MGTGLTISCITTKTFVKGEISTLMLDIENNFFKVAEALLEDGDNNLS